MMEELNLAPGFLCLDEENPEFFNLDTMPLGELPFSSLPDQGVAEFESFEAFEELQLQQIQQEMASLAQFQNDLQHQQIQIQLQLPNDVQQTQKTEIEEGKQKIQQQTAANVRRWQNMIPASRTQKAVVNKKRKPVPPEYALEDDELIAVYFELKELKNRNEEIERSNKALNRRPRSDDDGDDDGGNSGGDDEEDVEEEMLQPPTKKKRVRRKGPVGRPTNCFILFSNDFRDLLRARFPDTPNSVISIHLGTIWAILPPQEKEPYQTKAGIVRVQHKQEHPEFHYGVTRKATRIESAGRLENIAKDLETHPPCVQTKNSSVPIRSMEKHVQVGPFQLELENHVLDTQDRTIRALLFEADKELYKKRMMNTITKVWMQYLPTVKKGLSNTTIPNPQPLVSSKKKRNSNTTATPSTTTTTTTTTATTAATITMSNSTTTRTQRLLLPRPSVLAARVQQPQQAQQPKVRSKRKATEPPKWKRKHRRLKNQMKHQEEQLKVARKQLDELIQQKNNNSPMCT